MLGDISGLDQIYIVCGYTDMRKSIDGLCAIVEHQLKLDPSASALFSSVEEDEIELRLFIMNRMVLF